MSLYDDMEHCDHCLARLRPGGCTRWGTEVAPCEEDFDEDYCDKDEEELDGDE